jgi:NADH-quinone oxidoreductase subunit L
MSVFASTVLTSQVASQVTAQVTSTLSSAAQSVLTAEDAAAKVSDGFFLANSWWLPVLSFVGFWLILLFSKRINAKSAAAYLGIAVIGLQFAFATAAVVQWQTRTKVEVAHGGSHSADESHSTDEESHSTEGTDESHSTEEGSEETHSTEESLGAIGAASGFAVAAEEGEVVKLRPALERSVSWYRDGDIDIRIGTHIDGFAVAMLFVVAFISLCVHVFSREYLRTDSRITHYFAALSLFTGAMLWMVQSATTLGILFGWEVMGLCSFLLIGHWWEDKNNTNAALKAFFTTRSGDVGLLIGIVILFFAGGKTFDIATINEKALNGEIRQWLCFVAATCLFLGVIGKSAQFPLHTWLPDAMAGPTPASSLIHAATMVVAGVYLVARLYGVFWSGFSISAGGMNLGALVGSTTLVMAALLAFVQTDIKKVLAYSTVSQLGYMVMGLAVGGWAGAIFHLVTHAFFKALLFQASGSIAHSGSHHSFEMERMGGLRKYMPITFATFTMGYLALCGMPIWAGFWSKDEILNAATKNGYTWAYIAGSLGAFLTACYMTRAYTKTFFGENRLHLFHDEHDTHDAHDVHAALDTHAVHDTHAAHDTHAGHDDHGHDDHGHDGPHESNIWITAPLIALAVMSTVVGLLQFPGRYYFEKFIMNTVFEESVVAKWGAPTFDLAVAIPSTLIGLAGIVVGVVYYKVFNHDLGLVKRGGIFALVHRTLKNKYYLDHLWTGLIVGFVKGPLAKAAYWFNQHGLDGVVNGVGRSSAGLSKWVYRYIDQGAVDTFANGIGSTANNLGSGLRKTQTGNVQHYAAIFIGAVGLAVLAIVLFI